LAEEVDNGMVVLRHNKVRMITRAVLHLLQHTQRKNVSNNNV
jgi:hypothetical protein